MVNITYGCFRTHLYLWAHLEVHTIRFTFVITNAEQVSGILQHRSLTIVNTTAEHVCTRLTHIKVPDRTKCSLL